MTLWKGALAIGLVAISLNIASCSQDTSGGTSEPVAEVAEEAPRPDTFEEASSNAMAAAEATQTAQTPDEWNEVATSWQKAIKLMQAVPESSANYQTAQRKAVEYQANLEYAQRNVLLDAQNFVAAARDGDLNKVEQALSAGINPNSVNESGTDALSMAVGEGHKDIAQVLLEAGVSQEVKNEALTSAAGTGPVELVTLLLEKGADPQSAPMGTLGEPRPSLLSAAQFGSPDKVKVLLAAGASWGQLDQAQLDDALLSASCSGWEYTVVQLLAAGADPSYRDDFGDTPLSLAQSETCRTLDITGGPIQPGSRQHDLVLQRLRSAG